MNGSGLAARDVARVARRCRVISGMSRSTGPGGALFWPSGPRALLSPHTFWGHRKKRAASASMGRQGRVAGIGAACRTTAMPAGVGLRRVMPCCTYPTRYKLPIFGAAASKIEKLPY